MARRVTPAQFRQIVQQMERDQKRAIDDYNRKVRKSNADRKRAVDDYNRKARAHNDRLRTNQLRLKREIERFNRTAAQPRITTRYVTYRRSVRSLQESFHRIEEAQSSGHWTGGTELFDLAEQDVANSVAAYNAMLAAPSEESDTHGILQKTTITTELAEFSMDLDRRWRGALYALSPANPDAARQFCASARELLTKLLESQAPDTAVKAAIPDYPKTPQGSVSRRARILYLLHRRGHSSDGLDDFAEHNVNDAITLFDEFNSGTHGEAGVFDFPTLLAIKQRLEGVVQFLHALVIDPT